MEKKKTLRDDDAAFAYFISQKEAGRPSKQIAKDMLEKFGIEMGMKVINSTYYNFKKDNYAKKKIDNIPADLTAQSILPFLKRQTFDAYLESLQKGKQSVSLSKHLLDILKAEKENGNRTDDHKEIKDFLKQQKKAETNKQVN